MNISGNTGSMERVKKSYKNLLALGEGANGADFRMTFDEPGYDDLEFLVQSTQFAAMAREMIESKGPHGVMFNQQGNYKNAVDVPITFKSVVSGKERVFLRDWVRNKRYITCYLAQISESAPESTSENTVTYEDCWIEIDGMDLSVDDGAVLVKPSGTLHVNWASHADDPVDQQTLSWE